MIANEILALYFIPKGFMVSFLRKPEANQRGNRAQSGQRLVSSA